MAYCHGVFHGVGTPFVQPAQRCACGQQEPTDISIHIGAAATIAAEVNDQCISIFQESERCINGFFGIVIQARKTVKSNPIKELADTAATEKIIAGLEKGNLVPVTYVKDGNDAKMAAMANPQFKSVELYAMDGRKLFVENEKKVKNGQQVDNAQKAGVEAKVENEEKRGRKRGG